MFGIQASHHSFLLFLFSAHLAFAVFWDIKERRVPNKVVLSGLLTAMIFHTWMSGLPGVGATLLGAVTGLAMMLPLNLMRLMGAGDVKLMAMTGAFAADPQTVLWMVLYTLLAGGILAVLYASKRGIREKLSSNLLVMLKTTQNGTCGKGDATKPQAAARLPYAVAIACGSLSYLIFSRL